MTAACGEGSQGLHGLSPHHGVKPIERLVEDQDTRTGGERDLEIESAELPLGERLELSVLI